MRCFSLLAAAIYLLLTLPLSLSAQSTGSSLAVVDQDFPTALALAKEQDKMLLVDFYTTWCGPCKQLDKYVFRNDSLRQRLAEDVVLLKYDAENDTVFHLSKKYHIFSYPTGLLLSNRGDLIDMKRGFPGEDTPTLGSSVLSFVAGGRVKNDNEEYLRGYGNTIDPTIYPQFYTDFIDRRNTKVKDETVNAYLQSSADKFSEAYFVVLVYFADALNEDLSLATLRDIGAYQERFGYDLAGNLEYQLVNARFNRAIKAADQTLFDEATHFATERLGEERAQKMARSSLPYFLQAQGRWQEVIDFYAAKKAAGEMDDGYLNHVSYTAYLKSDDPEVLDRCIVWMQEVTDQAPEFDYLDTYAFLLSKAGRTEDATNAARRAIEVGRQEGASERQLKKLGDLLGE